MSFEHHHKDETLKKRFIYTKHDHGDEVVFECIAESISEADKKYQAKLGIHPEKQSDVGCAIEDIEKYLA